MKQNIIFENDKIIYTSTLLKGIIKEKDFPEKNIKQNRYYYLWHFNFNRAQNPLLAIDYLIEGNKNGKIEHTERLEKEILETFNFIMSSSGLDAEFSWDDVLKNDFWNSKNEERKAAFLVLHILANNFENISFPKINIFRIIKFLNTALPDIAKKLSVDMKEQTYRQSQCWKDFGKKIFEEFSKINIEYPETYFENRETLNKFFSIVKYTHSVFLGFEGFHEFPENLFSIISNFKNEIHIGNMKKAHHEMMVLKSLFTNMLAKDSFYSRYFIFPIFYHTLKYFDEEIKEAAKPSILSIKKIDRRYPFFDKHAKIILRINIVNEGGGFANNINLEILFDPKINILAEGTNKFSHHWTQLAPGNIILEIPMQINTEFNSKLYAHYEITWYDWELKYNMNNGKMEYECETKKVDWTLLDEERYSIKPISNDAAFVSRENRILPILNDIKKNLGSAWFYGAKRIGKTSTLLGIKRALEESNDFIVAATDYGGFSHAEPTFIINKLVRELSEDIKNRYFIDVQLPDLDGSFSPMLRFIKNVHLKTRKKIYIFIDECDELPYIFYTPNNISQPFWQTIRSISLTDFAGILLVGGENVHKLKIAWGDSLNLFKTYKADKFKVIEEWKDYSELIKKPVSAELDFTDDAVQQIYNISGGNPFFTKLLCRVVQRQSGRVHNSYISAMEVMNAVSETITSEAEMDHFQHFIKDGLKGEEVKNIRWQQLRAKFLFFISQFIDDAGNVNHNKFKEECKNNGRISEEEYNKLNDEFQERNIFFLKDEKISFDIPLFAKFLKVRGNFLLPSFFKSEDELKKKIEIENKLRVKSEETLELIKIWGVYQGTVISESNIQNWPSQFGDIETQREVFDFIKKIKFITKDQIITSAKYAYKIAQSNIEFKMSSPGQRFRDDIYVSYLDGPGKSGAWLANQFKEINQILKRNILELTQLKNVASSSENPFKKMKALVFVDDFVGSGKELCNQIENYANVLIKFSTHYNVKTVLFVAFALEEGRERVLGKIHELKLPIHAHFGEIFNESEKIFSETSRYFQNKEARERMKSLLIEYGNRLVDKNPLGYNNSEVAIVFPENCPNNSLPILWAKKESETFNWTPLFPRILW